MHPVIDVKRLIPQREPMLMVDALYRAGEGSADTGLTVREDNVFCLRGQLIEPGLIEHVAQSAAAMAGYESYSAGKEPGIGYIGEIKAFTFRRLPKAGEQLRTHLDTVASVLGTTLVTAETRCGEEVIAAGSLKIYLQT